MAVPLTAAWAVPPRPPDVPFPTAPTVGDALSTTATGGDVRGALPGADFCRTSPRQSIALPRDDGAHPGAYLEFWQWPITLTTRSGRVVGVFLTFEERPWAGVGLAQMTVTDVATGRFHQLSERMVMSSAPRSGFALRSPHASAIGGAGVDELRLHFDGQDLRLRIKQHKPVVLAFGDGHATAYCENFDLYSRTRESVSGTSGREAVVGTGSFDHLWGFYPAAAGTETTALKYSLKDGRDILLGLARMPRSSAISLAFGWVSDRSGRVTRLRRGDYTLGAVRQWSAGPGCSYPVDWDVTVLGTHLHSRPLLDATEIQIADLALAAAWPEWPRYWDGPTRVTGDVGGVGWMDLTHYCAG